MRTVAGEFKTLNYGLTTAKRGYPSGALWWCINFIPRPGGSIARRPGIRLVKSFKVASDKYLVGQPVKIGSTYTMYFAKTGASVDGYVSVNDRELHDRKSIDQATYYTISGIHDVQNVFNIGPGEAVGNYNILPISNQTGGAINTPQATDVTKTEFCTNRIAVQPTAITPSTDYSISIEYFIGTQAYNWKIYVTTPSTEFPEQLDISDIPAVVNGGNGLQANPNYSSQVAARQADYARRRAEWIRSSIKYNTIDGFLSLLLQAAQGKAGNNGTGGYFFGSVGTKWSDTISTFIKGQSLCIIAPNGVNINAVTVSPAFKLAFKKSQTADKLPSDGTPGQVVLVGNSDLVLRYDEGVWNEIPRMRVSGSFSLMSARVDGSNRQYVGIVNYGEEAPIPTSAPLEMVNAMQNAGVPIKTMYIGGRFCVICERAILVSAADKPFNFFPKTSSSVTAGDGAVVEISHSSSEYILDACAVRVGAFVITNLGAYVVNVSDITHTSIQRVRDVSFPEGAVHHILNVNGSVWHYWRTSDTQSIRVYTEGQYGGAWGSSDPIPHYDISREKTPIVTSMAVTSSGDTIYLSMYDTIKVFRVFEDHVSVFNFKPTIGRIGGLAMSGDSLLTFSQIDDYMFIGEYNDSQPYGGLDLWHTPSVGTRPSWAEYATSSGMFLPSSKADLLPVSEDPTFGNKFSSALSLLPPQQPNVSTPSAIFNTKDFTIHVKYGHDIAVNDETKTFTYYAEDGNYITKEFSISRQWSFTHPVYGAGAHYLNLSNGTGPFSYGEMEITHVTYRLTVYRDETPSSWA